MKRGGVLDSTFRSILGATLKSLNRPARPLSTDRILDSCKLLHKSSWSSELKYANQPSYSDRPKSNQATGETEIKKHNE